MKKETVIKAFKEADDLDYSVEVTTTNMMRIFIPCMAVHNMNNEIEFTEDCLNITLDKDDQQYIYYIPYEHIVTLLIDTSV